MNTVESITTKLEAIRVVKSPYAQPERVERLFQKRCGWLSSFASFYTVLPEDKWLSVTKASIAGGGTSGMGQDWAVTEVKDMVTKGYIETYTKGRCQWVRPINTTALLEWAKIPTNLAEQGMTVEQWSDHGKSWVDHMNGE
jgi:hypothetical protein